MSEFRFLKLSMVVMCDLSVWKFSVLLSVAYATYPGGDCHARKESLLKHVPPVFLCSPLLIDLRRFMLGMK